MGLQRPKLVILEDDTELRESWALELEDRGFDPYGASNWRKLDKEWLAETEYALVDLRLEGASGLPAIEELKKENPSMRIVVLTGYGTIATAVEAMKLGAAHYLTKPVSIDTIVDTLFDVPSDLEEGIEDDLLPDQRTTLARKESEYIEYVLAQCQGNITHAARWLGIRRQSLQRKLKKFPPSH